LRRATRRRSFVRRATNHAAKSGVCHRTAPDDSAAIAKVRTLLSYLPSNNAEDPPRLPATEPVDRDVSELDTMVPTASTKLCVIKNVVKAVVDGGAIFEVQEKYAQNIVIGFARIGGRSVGVVANQPMVLVAGLDIGASLKAACTSRGAAPAARLSDGRRMPGVSVSRFPCLSPRCGIGTAPLCLP